MVECVHTYDTKAAAMHILMPHRSLSFSLYIEKIGCASNNKFILKFLSFRCLFCAREIIISITFHDNVKEPETGEK